MRHAGYHNALSDILLAAASHVLKLCDAREYARISSWSIVWQRHKRMKNVEVWSDVPKSAPWALLVVQNAILYSGIAEPQFGNGNVRWRED